MLNKIIGFSIQNKLIIGLCTLALLGYGIYETTQLPIDAVPDITNNQVQVITVAPSFGATDIERLVTFPIEQALSNIGGMKELRSFSRFGLSLVTVVFTDEVDVYWARQQVAERLQKIQSQIPAGIGTPELGPISTGLGEIYQYVVRPKKGYEQQFTDMDLRTIQDWIVRRQLLGVKGVAEVSSFGGKLKQYEIAVNPDKLKAFELTIQDVFDALEKNNQNTGGSYIEKGPTVLFIRSEGLISSIKEIESVSVKLTERGTPIYVKDIADVKIGFSTRYGAMCYNDKGEVSGAVVMMLKGANSSEVIQSVKERIAQIQKTLPEGVLIEPFLDRTKMVNNAIGTVKTNLLEGALIVVFILVLFLGNFRAGFLVASVIPLSMLFAIILMNAFGVSGNLMSLGALDFGLIVDGAVIIVEAVMHQLSSRKVALNSNQISQAEMDKEVNYSAGKMMNSAVFGQIIILIVYLPIFSLSGIEGKMFKPMAQTVAFALIGAFILSLTYVPMMSALFLSKKVKHTPNISDRMIHFIEQKYQWALIVALKIPKLILGIVGGLFLISIVVFSQLGGEFIPALEEGDFAVETRVLSGSNLNVSIKAATQAAAILKKFPEVEKVVSKIGSGEVPTDPMPIEAQDLMVILKDKSTWTSATTFNELAEKMGKALEDIPGVTFGFMYPVQMRFNELMTGARQDVVCKIFGEDLDTLAYYANKLGAITQSVKGAADLYVEPVNGMPQVVVKYDRSMIAQYNLTISDVNRVLNIAFAGHTTGLVFEGEKRFDMVVRLDTHLRNSVEDIQNLLIPTPNGNQIALSQLADVAIVDGPNQIQREDAKRRIIIGFNTRGRDVQSIVDEVQTKVKAQITLPAGYYVTYGGAFENLNEAKQRLGIAVPVSLILILILLYFAFHSIKHSLLIYTAIPLSAIGGIYFLALRGMPFSISAGVGFIALFGVAVLNGIVLIAEFNRLKKSGLKNVYRIVLIGAKLRLRPVLMTAFVASLGFFPMAISSGAGAEVQRPLATVVIGGLILATFLTLFILPILYILFENTHKIKINFKGFGTVLLLFLSLSSTAQIEYINLQAAIDSSLKNNLVVKNQKLLSQYKKTLTQTSFNIDLTTIALEAGQLNSAYTDTRFVLSQTFNFPAVYSRQKQILNNDLNEAILSVSLTEAEIKQSVSILFYRILLLREKEKLLIAADQIFTDFLEKSKIRLSQGESNVLEKSFAEIQSAQIHMQLSALQTDIEIAKMQFQLLLNTSTAFEPQANTLILEAPIFIDTALVAQHPQVQIWKNQVQRAHAHLKLDKSALLPSINLGYYNQSMQGTGANNLFYTRSSRFQAGQIAILAPLFFKYQKAKMNSSKSMIQIAENQLQYKKQQLNHELNTYISAHSNYMRAVHTYTTTQLPNATILANTSYTQFSSGEINYLEWAMLNHQAIQIQTQYLELLEKLNQNTSSILFLTHK